MVTAVDTHRDEYVLMVETRPDTTKAVTAMTATETRSFIDGFGRTITSPTGVTYRTPVGADAFGETITTITAQPITIDGTTYQHAVDVSDRLGGPVRARAVLTGTAAGTLNLASTGRARGGEGIDAGWNMLEAIDIGHSSPGTDFHRWNPTQQGNSADSSFFPGVPLPPPTQAIRDRRMHCGQVSLYEVSGQRSRTCVVPMQFLNPSPQKNVGESATVSALSYGFRQLFDIRMNWGTSLATRATTMRVDYTFYCAKDYTSANCGGLPLRLDATNAAGFGGGYWNECKVYDLLNMGSPIVVPPSAIANVPVGSGGVNNFWTFGFSQRAAVQVNTVTGAVAGQVVRSPQASDYISVILRNTVTDWAYAYTMRLEPLRAQDLAIDPFVFVRDVLSQRPTGITMAVNWNATDATAAPVPVDDIYGIGCNGIRTASSRDAGWFGHSEYHSIGRTAHVMEAISTLYTSGDLDRTPFETVPPQSVTSGTYWPTAKLNAERIAQKVRMIWEATRT